MKMKLKVNKKALAKAIGVLAMSWLALPVLYYMFCKKGEKEENGEEEPGRENDKGKSESGVC